jgi:RNA polymerase sigma-70 factor (sigma-E family)
MDILVFPQSSGGFWGGVTECGLGSARSSSRKAAGGSAQSSRSGTGVGGEPVNTVVDGKSAKAVLDGHGADPVLSTDPVLAADPVLEAQVDVLQTQDVTAIAPEVMNNHDGQHGPSVLAALPGTDHQESAADMSAKRLRGDGAETYLTVGGEPPDAVARPTFVAETLAVSALVPEVLSAPAVWDADRVVTEIYHGEYKSLVRLAVLLVHDVPTAEEVVQDAFEAMHTAWRRLRDSEKALSYLRQAVVNKSRSVLRHRTVVDKNAPKPAPDEPSAEQGALALIERSAVVAALRTLPDRQREAIVLRYYADLSEADIAATMGISRGAVKSHTARAMAALKSILEQETS